jgi:adenosylhomocysteine nucleosidase
MSRHGQRLALLSALPEEQAGLLERLASAECVEHAGRSFWTGLLEGVPVVLALSRIGKVAAATTCTVLIERFGASSVVFTGVAGGTGHGVQVGDVVIGTHYVQYDMDASPLFPRYEIPLTGQSLLPGHPALCAALGRACMQALGHERYEGRAPRVHQGLIGSADRFVSSAQAVGEIVAGLRAQGHEVLAVEMEGAAVAQVCADYGIPFAAVRTISDRADDTAHVDFPAFVRQVAGRYACAIAGALLQDPALT